VAADGTAYVGGYCYNGMPVTDNAYQNYFGGGGTDGFLLVITP
jgi:hypothetical protein